MLLMDLLEVLDCTIVATVDRMGDNLTGHMTARTDDARRMADMVDRYGDRAVQAVRVGQYIVNIELAPEAGHAGP